jgi:hypothetical protein
MIEQIDKRDYHAKVFQTDDLGVYKMHYGLGLMHYFDGEKFEDIKPLPFPEGKIIDREDDLKMVEIPAWGVVSIEKDGSEVIIRDKNNTPIYKYHTPVVTKKDVNLYRLADSRQELTKEQYEAYIEKPNPTKKVEIIEENIFERPVFEVREGYICFKLKNEIKEPLRAYDDTAYGTDNGNTKIYSYSSLQNTNFSTETDIQAGSYATNNLTHLLIKWTMPSGTGTITDVKLCLYKSGLHATANRPLGLHKIKRTDANISQMTWNIYKTSTNWQTAGATGADDYESTVISSTNVNVSNNSWVTLGVMGPTATNSLTLDWSDVVMLMLKPTTTGNDSDLAQYRSKEYTTDTTKRPYLEITYTEAATDTSKFLQLF